MTEQEKKLLAEKEKEIASIPEKQELDKQAEAEVKNGDAIVA